MIKDVNPGAEWGAHWDARPIRFGDNVFFMGDDGVHGLELWKSNGTAKRTVMVKDINPGKNGSRPKLFIVAGNQLFFVANDGLHGQELWRTDGTSEGTRLVKELTPGDNDESKINFEHYHSVGSTLVFGLIQTDGIYYWRSDGTTAGTLPLKGLKVGIWQDMINYRGLLYFAANDGLHGTELWQTDGTVSGTTLTRELTPGKQGTVMTNFTSFQNKFYFFADTTFQTNSSDKFHGASLWQSDGTATGTLQVINPQPDAKQTYSLQNLTGAGNRLYFYLTKNGNTTITELWRSDGTAGGTSLVKPIKVQGLYQLSPLGSTVFFTATDPVNGMQLWKSDGTATGTALVKVIAPAKGGMGFSLDLGVLKSTLFFTADDGVHGLELWQTDGTAAGTKLTKDIDPGNPPTITPASQPTDGVVKLTRRPISKSPFRVFSTDGLYFIADDGVHGRELWWIAYDSVN
ncbi:hypothetical protein GCM10028819_09890 [Spirosoma humi]